MPRIAFEIIVLVHADAAVSPPPQILDLEGSKSASKSPVFFFFLGGIVTLMTLLILAFLFWKFIKQAKLKKLVKPGPKQQDAMDLFSGNLRTISYFSFHALKKATKDFHPANLLGKGGFGPVYQGKLQDGRLVAVKKLSLDKSQQGESEFLAEVRMITSIQHKNLVRLLGCCTDGNQRLLVYEYMKNRSLDLIVYGKTDHGYTAPEYAIRGELTEKADIYSFGVLVLEIISCRKNTDLTLPSEMQYLPEYAWKMYERSKVLDIVDPRMREDGFVEKGVMRAIQVAFFCLQPHPDLRPKMSQAVAMLTCKGEMVDKPMKPAFLDRKRKRDDSFSWDIISEAFPSPLRSESPSCPRYPS
ncbi:Serine-threonine/tyrosine-protein kinase, catalytic domain [Dillenia turbinata]|uniref:Serine-threonine/tyrosine-protein kinase, catalytic domain n=1 Tax=Dillenia turbinata TaxID=194707 RepID=A0AAN8ZNF2_9MAGN